MRNIRNLMRPDDGLLGWGLQQVIDKRKEGTLRVLTYPYIVFPEGVERVERSGNDWRPISVGRREAASRLRLTAPDRESSSD